MSDFAIEPLVPGAEDRVLALLDEVLGAGHTADWFAWKHRENPAGASLAWVARDEAGLVGVRFLMPWRLTHRGRTLLALRPLDTATAKRARRRGAFKSLTAAAVTEVAGDGRWSCLFNTPNERSRPGYATMGWTILPPIRRGWRPVLPGPRASLAVEGAIEALAASPPPAECLATRRDVEYLGWRYAHRSGHDYGIVRLEQCDQPNGIAFRCLERRGLRLLLVCDLAGGPAQRALLVRNVARRERAVASVFATGPGARPALRPWLQRGGSHLAVRPLKRAGEPWERVEGWALSSGDLENVL